MPDFKKIFDVYSSDKSLSKFREFVEQAEVVTEFYTVFPDMKKIAKPVKVDKSVLYMTVENSVWKSELKFKEKLIVDKINSHFGKELIRTVKFI